MTEPSDEPEYLRDNRANWDERAVLHAESPDYRLADFDDPAFLSDVVRFDLPRLGSVAGVVGVHLQCHLGTDTISLARLGARMTGLDLSPESLRQARRLAERVGAQVDWVVADVYDAVGALGSVVPGGDAVGAFDLVYVSVGAVGWLPSIKRWAAVVAALLRPGGRLFIRDVHPVVLSIADVTEDHRLVIEHPYFEQPEATVYDEPFSYVETSRELTATRNHAWSHGIGETISALLAAGLRLSAIEEHDTVPFAPFGDLMSEVGGGEYRLIDRPGRVPVSFTLQAVKPD